VGPPLGRLAVTWDLDGTVARSAHRKHLIPLIKAGEATWLDYHRLCPQDEPIPGAVTLMRLMTTMNKRVQHIAVSYRSQLAMGLTVQWALDNDVPLSRFMLCPEWWAEKEDPGPRTSGLWKVSCIQKLRDEGIEVAVHMEDWLEDAEVITEMTGVPVLRCTEAVFDGVQPWLTTAS
jgi:hypothetical protein